MVANPFIPASVSNLLDQAEQLQPSEFKQFMISLLALNASRKHIGLPQEEAWLLKKINIEFSPSGMKRFLLLDEKRKEGTLSPEEHKELLALVRRLEKYDAQKMQWIGQLALLRKIPLNALIKELGLYQSNNG